jgi:tetratricopeptide (TPR) repeat protein
MPELYKLLFSTIAIPFTPINIPLWGVISTGIVLLVGGIIWWKITLETSRYYYNIAIDLYNKGKRQEALRLLEKAFKKEPSYQPVLYNIGVIQMELGDKEMAKSYFQLSLLEEPEDTYSLYNLGLIFYEEELFEEAIKNWLECIQYSVGDDIDLDVYYGLGLAYEGLEQWQTALEVYERNYELNPEHTDSKIAIGRLACELGDSLYADKLLAEVLEEDPENQEALLYAALVAVELKQWDAAELYCTTLLAMDDENAHAFNLLGITFFYAKRYTEAEECFEAALELDEHWVSPLNNLAYVYEKQGRITHAKMQFRQVQASESLTTQLENDSQWMIKYLKNPDGVEELELQRLGAELKAEEDLEDIDTFEPLLATGETSLASETAVEEETLSIQENGQEGNTLSIMGNVAPTPTNSTMNVANTE